MGDDVSRESRPIPESPLTSATGLGHPRIINRSSVRRHRATVACNHCRFRKVRCSVVSGHPCYNCIVEEVECILPHRRPRGKPKAQKPSASSQLMVDILSNSSTKPPDGPASTWSEITPDLPRDAEANGSRSPCAIQPEHPHRTLDGDKSWDIDETVAPDRNFDWYEAATQSLTSPISPDDTVPRSNVSVHPPNTLPDAQDQDRLPFVKPMPSDLAVEDLIYLRQRGALTLPNPELRDDLLKNYVELAHYFLPLIDLDSFQASIENPARHGQISLLLLQAIMYSATAWADVKLVRRAGFLTRDAMRRAYYLKTKLLYDFNCERDRIAIVQSLVLLTTWWVSPTEQKDGYYWCSVALAVAKSIGLHRDAHSEGLPAPVRRLRRRIWWCCLSRDAFTSLGTNRAPRVRPDDFTVAPLTLEDMSCSDSGVYANEPHKFKLTSIFFASTKICRILSTIVDLFYAENPIGHNGILYPKQDDNHTQPPRLDDLEKLEMCERDLQRWRDQVSDDLLHQYPVPTITSSADEAVVIHRAMLAMMYLVAQFCLHRPRALADRMGLGAGHDQMRASQRSMRAAAADLNKIVMDLYRADLMRRLPGTSISCILTVSWSHVFDLQSASDERRREGARRFEECKLALRELVETNVAAEWAIGFLTFAASHVSRLFKRRQVQPLPPDGGLARTVSRKMQHAATPVLTGSDTNAAGTHEPATQDWTDARPLEMQTQTRQGSGVGLSDFGDSVMGSVFNLPDDDIFNLDFSNLTDMWVGMPSAA
ncbi:uncharacterized protein Z520_09223 [Fonsecaea multimorphosa CBS 102226]|uniref:Zn(2)-C6 fungal-type domain-containing protein n=1 Tax=Fonsecaea multimorphosa CBS 102226 TaxID=1442371 RepID=A0A0D2KE10_9EURO|nr:uncharacterized protein Z520_09223 [Fonsecaea multimorphosa CBS 102226]KIX94913.1 hypothetical protein Z520_09223 [Fonsecaea multimorphosa CBS 102226]OAL20565.1 hypothetical protein AYO22_08574 [Fonsecaea multimorphosa]